MSISLLKYIIKRPKIIAFSTMGILLATAFIFASFMIGDYAIGASVMKELKQMKIDMIAYASGIRDRNKIINTTLSIEHVIACEPFLIFYWLFTLNSTKGNTSLTVQALFINENSSVLSSVYEIVGRLPKDYDEVVISDEIAENLNVGINSTILLCLHLEEETELCLNMSVVGIVTGISEGEVPFVSFPTEYEDTILLNYDKWIEFASQISGNVQVSEFLESIVNNCNFAIVIDKENVVDPLDISGSIGRVMALERKIETEMSKYCDSVSINNLLMWKLYGYVAGSFIIKLRFFVTAFPVLLMGWVLALMTNWVFFSERRTEIGLLKVRGATSRQILFILLFEGILVGVFGAILGGLLSYPLADEFIKMSLVEIFKIEPVLILNRVYLTYLWICIIFGVVFGFLSILFPARKAAKMPVNEALSERIGAIEERAWKSKWAWIFLIIGTYGIIENLLHQYIFISILSTALRSHSFFAVFILILMGLLEVFATYVGPFLFMYVVSKFVAFYASKARKVFSVIVKPIAGKFYQVAIRNFARRPARTARVVLLLTLMFATIFIFSISTSTSIQTYKVSTQFSLGADIRIEVRDIFALSKVNWTKLANNISSIEGVNAITRISYIYKEETEGLIHAFCIIDSTYFNSTFFKMHYIEQVENYFQRAFDNGSEVALMSVNGRKFYGYKIGDTVQFEYDTKKHYLRIIGFVKFLPGITTWSSTQLRQVIYVLVPYKLLSENIIPTVILIDVKDEYNQTQIAEKLHELFDNYDINVEIRTFQDEMRKYEEEGLTAALINYFRVEFSIAILMAAVGMSLIMIMNALERRREIALLLARGASRRNILSTFLAESFLITVISLIIAFLVGIGFAISFSLPSSFTFDPITGDLVFYELPPELCLVIGIETIAFVFLGILLLSVVSVLPAYIVSKRNIAETLRVHH